VFVIFLAAYRDRNYVEASASSKLTIGTGDQDDAVDLDVSEIAVARHRCQTHVRSHTLKIHDWITSLRSIGSKREERHTKYGDGIDLSQSTRTLDVQGGRKRRAITRAATSIRSR
jgi:hypothetical protein